MIIVFWDVMMLHNLVHRFLGFDADQKVARLSFSIYNSKYNQLFFHRLPAKCMTYSRRYFWWTVLQYPTYQTTQQHISEDHNVNIHSCKNLNCHMDTMNHKAFKIVTPSEYKDILLNVELRLDEIQVIFWWFCFQNTITRDQCPGETDSQGTTMLLCNTHGLISTLWSSQKMQQMRTN